MTNFLRPYCFPQKEVSEQGLAESTSRSGFGPERIALLRKSACIAKTGAPVWALITHTVVRSAKDVAAPQGTDVDTTAQKNAPSRLRAMECAQSPIRMREGAIFELSVQMRNILRRVSKSLEPDNLSRIDRAEMQGCVLALEQMKMLLAWERNLRSV